MGPLGHPYPGFCLLILANIFYLFLSSIGLSYFLFCSILLFFLLYIPVSPISSFSRMDSCYTLKTGFSSTVSSSPSSISSIPYYTSYFFIHITFWSCTFLVILNSKSSYLLQLPVFSFLLSHLCYIPSQILLLIFLCSSGFSCFSKCLLLLCIPSITLNTCHFLILFFYL